jgi:sugar phosphate isomerase/epimerase
MSSRRTFIRQSAFTVASLAIAQQALLAKGKTKYLVGLQLYSVRDDMKRDPLGTLRALANMGYKEVEHANYVDRKFYGYTAVEFKKILNDLGMKMPSGHTVLKKEHFDAAKNDFTDAWKYTVEDAAYMGQLFVISPSMEEALRRDYDALRRQMEVFNKAGELCQQYKMKFGYHNHDFEFSEKLNGRTLYDIILKETDIKLVIQQLDTGNLYNGGANAADIVKLYPGRFASLHVKDEIAVAGAHEKYESTILGKGIVPLQDILKTILKSQPDAHLIIEQEAYQGKAPLQSMQENMQVMKQWGYV